MQQRYETATSQRSRPLIVELNSIEEFDTDLEDESDHSQPASETAASREQTEAPAAEDAAVSAALQALHAVPSPPEELYADISGTPIEPDASQRPAARDHIAAAAAALHTLSAAVSSLTPQQVDWGHQESGTQTVADSASSSASWQRQQRQQTLIEDITDQPEPFQPQLLPAAEVLAACALYAPDPILESAWATAGAAAAAASALASLAALLPPQLRWHRQGASTQPGAMPAEASEQPAATSSSASPAAEAAQQRSINADVVKQQQVLLALLLQGLVAHLRPAIMAPKQRDRKYPDYEFRSGPGEFVRFGAARRIAWVVRQFQGPIFSTGLPTMLPPLLAFIDDPAMAVQRAGMQALHHMATMAPPESLAWHQALLADTAVRCVTAADERIWPTAAPAMCALTVAVLGNDAWAAGYDRLMQAMLSEAELHEGKAEHRIIWLRALLPVLQAIRAVAIRYFARLMPLLLGWLHAADEDTRAAARDVLMEVVRHCWPRMPPHAGLVWQHLQAAFDQTRQVQGSSSGARLQLQQLAQLLYDCGGDSFHLELAQEAADKSAAGSLACSISHSNAGVPIVG